MTEVLSEASVGAVLAREPVLVAAPAPPADEVGPAQVVEAPDVEPEPEPAKVPARTAGRGSRRAAVPSWDEILFGSRNPET